MLLIKSDYLTDVFGEFLSTESGTQTCLAYRQRLHH